VQAATQLFAEKGCVRTRLDEVGARAGYTGGLVSNRYGSKVGLVRAVLDDIYRRFRRETLQQVVEQSSVVDRLETYVRVFLERISGPRSDVNALYVLMGEAMGAVPELRADVSRFTEQTVRALASLIEEGVAAGELHADLHPERAATLLLATMRGITFDHLARPEAGNPVDLAPEINRLLSSWTLVPERRPT
jgi:AcrR family transcriptional regulator